MKQECYKNQKWCIWACLNKECSQNFTAEEKASAVAWWGGPNPPIVIGDFRSEDCGYEEPENDTDY